MFNFLRAPKSTEQSVRDWAFRESMRFMPKSDEAEMRAFHQDQDLKRLVQSAVVACVRGREQAQSSMRLVGTPPDQPEQRHYALGAQLLNKLAEERGWTVTWEGSLGGGFKCTIKEKNG